MFKSLIFFARFFLFWLLFFALDRFLFLFIFHKKLREISLSEKILTFYHALRLDISMTAYLAVIPHLYFIFWFLFASYPFRLKWINLYNKVLIVLCSIIAVVNFNIYREWGTKINNKAISFAVDTPNEAFASSVSSPLILTFLILVLLVITGIYLQNRIFKGAVSNVRVPLWIKLPVILMLCFIDFFLIRGGLSVAPNSQSMAYFSNHEILNQASLNTEWNLVSSILASKKTHVNPYLYYQMTEAERETSDLYKVKNDTSVSILKTRRPNVVIFILESFTSDLTKTLGNENGITPNFDTLINHGLLFSKIYAAGNRTDKGLIGTLTGFPTLGTGSIVKWPEKMKKIPAISQKFAQNHYQTSFFYGGESEFDNYKAFLLSHDYHQLVDKNSFDSKDMNSKWGAYDGLVFNRQLKAMNDSKQPFFSTILSLTNHEPFELPVRAKFGDNDIIRKFKSTAYYTDSCINSYLTEAKKQAWYKNTLFIFIADHGHLYPKDKFEIFQPERYHIPLLFYGEVLKEEFRGHKIDKIGSQQDVPATLLAQLALPAKEFLWSKNLLNPYTQEFAFFSWDNGLAFMNNKQCVTFDNIGKNILYNNRPEDLQQTGLLLKKGKSYLQTAYQQFIKL